MDWIDSQVWYKVFALFRKTAEAVRFSVQVRVVDPLSRTTKRQFDRISAH